MKFEVTILGSSSATPTLNRNPTSQLINYSEQLFLVDCGEGTQSQLNKYGLKKAKINHIFISHLHGDHYFGLMGLLSSLHLGGRQMPMYLFGPEPLIEIINIQLKHSKTRLRYDLHFKATDPKNSEIIFENDLIEVRTIPLRHKIDTTGFLFKEKPRPRKIDSTEIDRKNIPLDFRPLLKKGHDYTDKNGQIIKNEDLTFSPPPPRSYAFCSDTCFLEEIIPLIKNVDLLYHEATFLHELKARAKETRHTTAKEAGIIAKMANAKQLLIGHFSARYKSPTPLLEECKKEFENSLVAEEGITFSIEDVI
ncbi:MAG: ribonuclease Z [Sphingobacteriales bacterium]|jgi:ribonuclease Z